MRHFLINVSKNESPFYSVFDPVSVRVPAGVITDRYIFNDRR
jgi:hypothetical protein